jgi:hypothetical protein
MAGAEKRGFASIVCGDMGWQLAKPGNRMLACSSALKVPVLVWTLKN